MRFHFSRARVTAVAFVFLAVLLSSCGFSGFGNSRRRAPFDESEFAAYRGSGSGTVSGQLAVTSGGGAVHVGNFGGSTAGIRITLIPVTAYTREMVEREIGDGIYLGASDPRFRKYVRLTTTDGNGDFLFDHVPAGEYFVSGLGEWIELGYFKHQWACEQVTVAEGQSIRVSLTHNLHRAGRPLLRLWALE